MREVGAFDAKNKLGQLLDLVEQGEEITITRHGRPVARLVAPASRVDRNEARAALRRIRERAERMQSGPFDWDEWKALRDAGRP
jgi:prevent-host-death family protein